jgi:hypothetical protein
VIVERELRRPGEACLLRVRPDLLPRELLELLARLPDVGGDDPALADRDEPGRRLRLRSLPLGRVETLISSEADFYLG